MTPRNNFDDWSVEEPEHSLATSSEQIAEFLRQYQSNYTNTKVRPRGLINDSCWCYSHSVMQSLIAVAPFVHLFRDMDADLGELISPNTHPVCAGVKYFIKRYAYNYDDDDSPENDGTDSLTIHRGIPFRATQMYDMMPQLDDDFCRGRQQDAEEMLSQLLNAGHNELGGQWSSNEGSSSETTSDNNENNVMEDNSSQNSRSNLAQFVHTPISNIFWGTTQFTIKNGESPTVEKVEAFVTLPLVIEHENIFSLEDALINFAGVEEVSDYKCSKTNEIVPALARRVLHQLPEVLILQLKRFVYTSSHEMIKIDKHVEFNIDLAITDQMVSEGTNTAEYKLTSVISHLGATLNSGHYMCDVFNNHSKCWLRCDDARIHAITFDDVKTTLSYNRTPYLLFYQRTDTFAEGEFPIVGPSQEIITAMDEKMNKPCEKKEKQDSRGLYVPPHMRNRH